MMDKKSFCYPSLKMFFLSFLCMRLESRFKIDLELSFDFSKKEKETRNAVIQKKNFIFFFVSHDFTATHQF